MRETMHIHNNRRERIIARNKARRRRELQNHFIVIGVTLCLIILFSLVLGSFLSEAKEKSSNAEDIKCYKSVMLLYGETLEDVAQKYFDKEAYAGVDEYISEIMRINSLDNTSCVTPGQNVVIPYYTARS